MLYIIGLGLGDIKDITVKGLEIVKKCEKVKMDRCISLSMTSITNLIDLGIFRALHKYLDCRSS